MNDQPSSCTDEDLRNLIEDFVLTQVLIERLEEEAEPWEEMNGN